MLSVERDVSVDLTHIGSQRARQDLLGKISALGWHARKYTGFWQQMEEGRLADAPSDLVVMADLSRVAAAFRKTGRHNWHSVILQARPSLLVLVRGRRDQSYAAIVDDLVRFSASRLNVCTYRHGETSGVGACLNWALASTDARAVLDVRFSKTDNAIWVEFGDGLSAVIDWEDLGLSKIKRTLLPETTTIGEDPFVVEVLDSDGRTFEIDSLVIRAIVDDETSGALAREASSANEELGQKLRAKRLALGEKQIDLQERTGLQQSLISKLELGRHQPTFATLERYAKGLGLTVSELLA